MKYEKMKQIKVVPKCPTIIRMTNAQVHADNAVKTKLMPGEYKKEFKLARFTNVSPRTSTKRGENAYMMSQTLAHRKSPAKN